MLHELNGLTQSSSAHEVNRIKLYSLIEELFAGIKFPTLNFTENFAGINFREMSLTKDFAAINFRESAFFKDFTEAHLTFAVKNIFPTTMVYGFENILSKN